MVIAVVSSVHLCVWGVGHLCRFVVSFSFGCGCGYGFGCEFGLSPLDVRTER